MIKNKHKKTPTNSANKKAKKKGSVKITDPLLKARSVRQSLLRRVKGKDKKENTPSIQELHRWFSQKSFICEYSGAELDISQITIDHKTPIKRGGDNSKDNLCIATYPMNLAKGSMTAEEFFALLNLVSTWEDGGESLLRRLRMAKFG